MKKFLDIIEEATVQFMTEEICKYEGIEIIESDYYETVDALKQIGRYIGMHKTDYDFAKFMIETPVTERLDWISDKLDAKIKTDVNMIIEKWQKWANLRDMLYV